MMMRQQQQDRRDEQERQRRADAQLQMQNNMMQTMMMAVLGGNSGFGNMMPQMAANMMQNVGAVAPVANGAGENHQEQRRLTGRERLEARQMERQRAADEAAISREESIQLALAADPNMTREELERMIAEGEREAR